MVGVIGFAVVSLVGVVVVSPRLLGARWLCIIQFKYGCKCLTQADSKSAAILKYSVYSDLFRAFTCILGRVR